MMDRRWNSAWSVGRLLSLAFPYGDGGDLPPAVVAAMERGVAVHAACQEWDLGQGYTPPEPINGYLDAWKAYLRAHTPSWEEGGIERRFDSTELGYHGVIDRLGTIRGGKPACVEIKSVSAPTPSHPRTPIQLAAYTLAHYGRTRAPRVTRLEVQLRPDGSFVLFTHDLLTDFLLVDELRKEAGII